MENKENLKIIVALLVSVTFFRQNVVDKLHVKMSAPACRFKGKKVLVTGAAGGNSLSQIFTQKT